MGASAGGLATFKAFFKAMPPDGGAAFVLVQHLDPTRESLTAELVANYTRMPVVQVERDTEVSANHVYVIPPNKYLTIERGQLHLTPPALPRGLRMPVDQFLRSLAADEHERAIGIVLSGTGTDGALGLKEIKAAGGMTMAQRPETAQFDGMPRSAIATGGVDHVLAVEEMPAALLRYLRHAYVAETPVPPERDTVGELGAILAILRTRMRLDFGCYKKSMLRRRILRRMSLRHVARMADYVAELRTDGKELRALGEDLLINVTSFFRDPLAWQVLEHEVIGPLVDAKKPGEGVRVWVPGCASGEEAYSIAMLLFERLQAARKMCPVQIFATDIDDAALDLGRAGVYPESIAADVMPERLHRFFLQEGHAYRVNEELREAVTFARQNLLTDAPFSRLDLLSCRNLLIYLESGVQERILTLLHFSLTPKGCLFLGSAETIGEHDDLFEAISKKWRIYRRIGPSRQDKLAFPIGDVASAPPSTVVPRPLHTRIAVVAEQALRDRYVPASVVINRRGEILYFAGPTQKYLVQPSGPPTPDVFVQAVDGLRTQLRTAVQQAIRQGGLVRVTSRAVRRGKAHPGIVVSVEPFKSGETEGLLLVSFQDEVSAPSAEAATVVPASEASAVRDLESELKTTREELRTTIEQLETANEELKASNEEFMSTNEELQSTNEELQTSKEELQSLNEELNTINSQLESKVDELGRTNNDLDSLLGSTNIAMVFLDQTYRIRRFTAPATRLFALIPADVGRPLADVAQKFDDPDLMNDLGAVLEKLAPVRREVQTHDGHWYLRETLPYRTRDNRIEGVVITFSDAAEEVLREARLRAEAIVEAVPDGLVVLDPSLRVVMANREFCDGFRVVFDAIRQKGFFTIDRGGWDVPELRAAVAKVAAGGDGSVTVEVRRSFARIGARVLRVRVRRMRTSDARPSLLLLAIEDVTPRQGQAAKREPPASGRRPGARTKA
jgi:two-component system, chemotaxis family, CheB/CheR fusion protein